MGGTEGQELRLWLQLRSQFETWSEGPRPSIEDSFLVSSELNGRETTKFALAATNHNEVGGAVLTAFALCACVLSRIIHVM